jgi:serine/threonine protein kinase
VCFGCRAGHYGVVRKGMRRSDGVRVAVKTVPKRRAVYVEMLRNEIAILRGLDHANIIKLYDEFEDEKQVGEQGEGCCCGAQWPCCGEGGERAGHQDTSGRPHVPSMPPFALWREFRPFSSFFTSAVPSISHHPSLPSHFSLPVGSFGVRAVHGR